MKDNTKILIFIADIVIILFLCFYVWNDSKQYSCAKCEVVFKSNIAGGDTYVKEINISPYNLLDGLIEGQCLVKWDRTNGWMLNG